MEGCGLVATFIGVLLEGEISMLTSIISAKMGLFSFYWALVVGFTASYMQTWFKFYIAKKHGSKLLNKKPKLKEKIDKTSKWFDKRPSFYLIIYKFIFGLTTVIIVLAGVKNMSYLKFGFFNAIATLLWLAIFGGLGYFCAEQMIENMNSLADKKCYIIGSLAMVSMLIWFLKHKPHNDHCLKPID